LFIDFLQIDDIAFARYKSKKGWVLPYTNLTLTTFHQEVGLEENIIILQILCLHFKMYPYLFIMKSIESQQGAVGLQNTALIPQLD
jgi:hypothetical protein